MTHTAKHTPGPWVPYNSDKGRIFSHWYIRVDSGPTIVTVHNGLPDNQDMGNAHLIAAAPAMYEAIRKVIEHRAKDYLDNTIEPYCSLVAALAQAEGKQKVS